MIQQRLRTRGSDWPTCQGSTIMGGRPDASGIRAASPNRCCSIYAHTTHQRSSSYRSSRCSTAWRNLIHKRWVTEGRRAGGPHRPVAAAVSYSYSIHVLTACRTIPELSPW